MPQPPILSRKLNGKVLIVEDDLEFGGWLQAKLKEGGLTCTWAKTCSEAENLIQNSLFHAVVTDVFFGAQQPDGIKIVKLMEPTGTPTIVMSSAANLKIAKEAMNHGASYLLEKPFQGGELLNTLNRLWEDPKGLNAMVERFLDLHGLTPKEKEVVRLLLKGLSNKEMAMIEGNTDRTIKFHLTSVFQKCGVTTRTELMNAIFPS